MPDKIIITIILATLLFILGFIYITYSNKNSNIDSIQWKESSANTELTNSY